MKTKILSVNKLVEIKKILYFNDSKEDIVAYVNQMLFMLAGTNPSLNEPIAFRISHKAGEFCKISEKIDKYSKFGWEISFFEKYEYDPESFYVEFKPIF